MRGVCRETGEREERRSKDGEGERRAEELMKCNKERKTSQREREKECQRGKLKKGQREG